MKQLPLPLPTRAALDREAFIVGGSNALALAWIERWPAWPTTGLLLLGPAGSGKSHLASVWRAQSGARLLTPAALVADGARTTLGDAAAAVIENAEHEVAHAPFERELFHLFNILREREGHLLLPARTPPREWPVALPDLRSRLLGSVAAELTDPDDELLEALLIKLFADRQLYPSPEALIYLRTRIERSFAAAQAAVAALDAAALGERRPVTLPLARRVLAESGLAPGGEAFESHSDSE